MGYIRKSQLTNCANMRILNGHSACTVIFFKIFMVYVVLHFETHVAGYMFWLVFHRRIEYKVSGLNPMCLSYFLSQ